MKYSIDYYGESYELPAYTLSIADKLEAQDALNRSNKSLREQCEGMYKTISDIVGAEFCDKAPRPCPKDTLWTPQPLRLSVAHP